MIINKEELIELIQGLPATGFNIEREESKTSDGCYEFFTPNQSIQRSPAVYTGKLTVEFRVGA